MNVYKKLRLGVFLGVIGAVFIGAKKAPDVIETLISDEQKAVAEWLASDAELPPVYLLGDSGGVRVFADFMETGDYEKLCGALDLDELVAACFGQPGQTVVPVNIGSPRVRQILGDSCVLRPKDVVVAVGEGWILAVTIKEFELRATPPVCSFDSQYSLWANFEETLPERPLFFVSNFPIPVVSTITFQSSDSLEKRAVDAEDLGYLSKVMEFLDDYSVMGVDLNYPNCDCVYSLKRKVARLTDAGDPNEVLLWRKGDIVEVLEMEVLDGKMTSGHINLTSVFDFNNDGFIDLWVSGDQDRCIYNLLFLGTERGFEPIKLPGHPCSC